MKITDLVNLILQAKLARYDYHHKEKYRRESRKFLQAISNSVGLTKGQYDLRFNPGGMAGSGDAVLHSENFYVHINDFGHYWRLCKGRKDYGGQWGSGWQNRSFEGQTPAEIGAEIKRILKDHENHFAV